MSKNNDQTEMVQCHLQQDNRTMIVWIENSKKIKQGARVTLKEVDGWWNIINIYSTKKKSELDKDWDCP